MIARMTEPIPDRSRTKFRQAAFVYLHVGLLYEAAVFAAWRAGMLPGLRGPVPLWLLAGAAIVALVFWGLWSAKKWFARLVWGVHALRLPALIAGAFFPAADARLPTSFYITALVVVVVNLWMLARAGWDI